MTKREKAEQLSDAFREMSLYKQERFIDDTDLEYQECSYLNICYPSGDYIMNTRDDDCDFAEILESECSEKELDRLIGEWLEND